MFSLKTFNDQFPNEKACVDWMIQHRWNNEPVCQKCGCLGAYRVTVENKDEEKPARYLLKCKACRKQFTVKVGTIFEDSAVPLKTWFLGIFLLTTRKKGISSIQFANDLEVSQKTGWYMLQRIRHAIRVSPTRVFEWSSFGFSRRYCKSTSLGRRSCFLSVVISWEMCTPRSESHFSRPSTRAINLSRSLSRLASSDLLIFRRSFGILYKNIIGVHKSEKGYIIRSLNNPYCIALLTSCQNPCVKNQRLDVKPVKSD